MGYKYSWMRSKRTPVESNISLLNKPLTICESPFLVSGTSIRRDGDILHCELANILSQLFLASLIVRRQTKAK